MRKRLKNLKNKGGHSENGAPRSLIDHATYRERIHAASGATPGHYDSEYAGWSWATRPRDQAISLRGRGPSGPTGSTGTTGPGIG